MMPSINFSFCGKEKTCREDNCFPIYCYLDSLSFDSAFCVRRSLQLMVYLYLLWVVVNYAHVGILLYTKKYTEIPSCKISLRLSVNVVLQIVYRLLSILITWQYLEITGYISDFLDFYLINLWEHWFQYLLTDVNFSNESVTNRWMHKSLRNPIFILYSHGVQKGHYCISTRI